MTFAGTGSLFHWPLGTVYSTAYQYLSGPPPVGSGPCFSNSIPNGPPAGARDGTLMMNVGHLTLFVGLGCGGRVAVGVGGSGAAGTNVLVGVGGGGADGANVLVGVGGGGAD